MIEICDVAPRDGLQNEQRVLPASVRAELVTRLVGAGAHRVEAASFVHPKLVPQMADAEDVLSAIGVSSARIAALVLNERGYERLEATNRVDEVHLAFACTETFNRRNANMSVEDSLCAVERIVARVHSAGLRASVTVGATFGCPFEGAVDERRPLSLAERAVAAGAGEVTFADTIGVAVPRQVRSVVGSASRLGVPIGLHLHNTRNTAYANALAGIEAGVCLLDASLGGIGGCPFAPNATGNICTEDLVYLLHGEGIDTGLDLEVLIETSRWLEVLLGRQLDGMVYRAGVFEPVSGPPTRGVARV